MAPTMLDDPRVTRADYDEIKRRAADRSRRASRSGRDIGALPPVADPPRREAARLDFRAFCESYFRDTFTLAWSPDHIRVLERVQRTVLEGAQLAIAMPRGSGKTSICEVAAVWAVLYGHRRYVVLIGASETAAHERLDTIVGHLENNDVLAEDFPEVCVPIAKLEGIANRCAGQTHLGERTHITWTQSVIVLPTIAGSVASAAIVQVAGITGRVRGMKFQRPDGGSVRPDLVICDDPQTDESANSLSQCATREKILAGAVLGLAGPGVKIAAIMPCTVIRAGDMADNILDRAKHPEWNGERTKLVYQFPTSKLWDRYGELRVQSLREHGDIRLATEFYRQHRAPMDEGAVVAWPERHYTDELSALQHAMNLRFRDEAAFAAEYQNEPLKDQGIEDAGILSTDQLAARLNGYARGAVPVEGTHLTAFIDVQQKILYYLVAAWSPAFSGFVLEYGAWPEQGRNYFTLNDAQRTLQQLAPNAGTEGAIYAGLESLTAHLLGREWVGAEGTPHRVGLCLIDASWGNSTDVVYQFARQTRYAAQVMPSHGRFVGASSKPLEEWAKKPGDRVGVGWRIPAGKGRRAVKHALYDANHWKTFVHSRFAQAIGDHGALTLYGKDPTRHRMLVEHLTAETRERMQGSVRVIDVWKLRPGARDNHLFDAMVGSAVAASILGAALPGMESHAVKVRKRVRLSDIQQRRRS